jgi:hypothetical protein
MPREHQSYFSYTITRPYPYRWFTPLAITGAVISITLFSLLNFVANGYELVLETSTNYNSTISSAAWLNRWPAYSTNKVRPTCQPVDIPIGSQLFTNQTGLTYQLVAAWEETTSAVGSTNRTILSSSSYSNNVLQNCTVNSIEMNLEALDRTASQFGFSEWGSVVQTYITCSYSSPGGLTQFNLTQTYDYIPATVSWTYLYTYLATEFLGRDAESRASLWWGESAMSNYYVYLTRTMQDIRANATANGETGIRKGTLYFTPSSSNNNSSSSSSMDIKSLDYFDIDCRFIIDLGYGAYDVITTDGVKSISQLDRDQKYPNVWVIADSLAKSVYSTILTDLGQVSASSGKPNFLADADDLQYFTSNFSLIQEHKANADPGPEAGVDYESAKENTGSLGITPSVISMRYFCQVPRLKSTGNIIVSILVADLVFLQATWTLFKIVVDWYMSRTRPGSKEDDKTGDSYIRLTDAT